MNYHYTDLKDHKVNEQKKRKNRKNTKRTMLHHGNSTSNDSYRVQHNSFDTVETTTTDYWISTKATPHVTPRENINNPYGNNGYNGRGRDYKNLTIDADKQLLTPQPRVRSNPSTCTRKSTFPELDISTPEYQAESTVIWSLDNV